MTMNLAVLSIWLFVSELISLKFWRWEQASIVVGRTLFGAGIAAVFGEGGKGRQGVKKHAYAY